jgi:hypothetical protein
VSPDAASATADVIQARYFETSAKNGDNVQELFADIAALVERPRDDEMQTLLIAPEQRQGSQKKWGC